MLSKGFGIFFLVLNVIAKELTILKDFYAIQTNELPKSSCHEISKIQIESRCLGACVNTMDDIVMISHDDSTETSMCCDNFTGSDILGQNWKSYVRRILPCANGYVSYDVMAYQICLKYYPVPVTYESARALCQTEGADLIKIDSQEKFDVFKDYHVPIANNTLIQVWIESIKVNGQWQFHDGSPMPNVCKINMSGGPEEVHVRARIHGSTDLYYQDGVNEDLFHYSCEYKP
ncbi:uncharacterized protein LOC128171220 [Crassostrea angulata]|uniref:uncharacterized protein LOC128171220 n=1 Tax=Magallana angulata TaxID=2784310 RepID=UPI0022B2178B|nr:uncharacterized protein LOC128171220 [Crassostrea angulata]